MAIINATYDVLSDPERRRAYDLWVAHQELSHASEAATVTRAKASSPPHTRQRPAPLPARSAGVLAHAGRYWFWNHTSVTHPDGRY